MDGRLFECRAVVKGVETEPMRFKEKTARRNRRLKTVKSKHRFTELVIKELKINAWVDGEGEGIVECRGHGGSARREIEG